MENNRATTRDSFKLGSKHWIYSRIIWCYFLTSLIAGQLIPVSSQRNTKGFKCPQQFGYFEDNTDCNKYYMCVFGDAHHDKCNSGLYFNTELRMCDWPRNVKACASAPKTEGISTTRQFGTSTPRPRSNSRNGGSSNGGSSSRSSNAQRNIIPNPNSIVVPIQNHRAGSRYTPPISREQYLAAARNSTVYRPPSSFTHTTSTTKPVTIVPRPQTQLTTSTPSSYRSEQYRATPKPVVIQSSSRESLRPLSSNYGNKRKDYEDTEYYEDGEEYEDEVDNSKQLLNTNSRNNVYVRPINPNSEERIQFRSAYTNSRTPPRSSDSPASNGYQSRFRNANSNSGNFRTDSSRVMSDRSSGYNVPRGQSANANQKQNSVEDTSSSARSQEDSSNNYNNFPNHRARLVDSNRYASAEMSSNSDSTRSQQTYNNQNQRGSRSGSVNSALSSVYTSRPRETDSLIQLRPQSIGVLSKLQDQSLDNGGDSLDAQFGTNPRSISLPDEPYRLNSFTSHNANAKAERNQLQLNKPKVTSTRYQSPARPYYQQDSSSEGYDDYPEYYYDDEEYYDDDDEPIPSPGPKVVFRLQKPSSSTTTTTRRPSSTTTRQTTTTTTTTRRTTTTTRKPPTTRPAKRQLPFGISRPATKTPLRFGPKALPKLPSRPPPIYSTPRALVAAEKCSSQKCKLPDCRCGNADIPGGISTNQVPQIVLITFDDAVNDLNYELYQEIFEGRKNPNGCPILGTFYVSHEWTDYGMVQTLYSKGHEMASHSITHSHGEKFSVSQWTKEIGGQREILHLYGGVKLEDIRGMRAPFLQVGGNNMFEMLYEANFTYDSSMPVLDNNPPYFPYTLDYSLNHECMIPPCPSKSFPGLWEVGMVMWIDYRGGRCSMGDACANPDNAEDVYQMLLKNFNRHYTTNRAPFGLYYHAAWFTTQHFRRGYMKFLEDINSRNDVYIVTNWQALQWMRDPTPLSRINSFTPWQCPKDQDKPGPCHHPTTCNIGYKGGSRNMRTCQPCPTSYPWTGRTGFDEVYA